MDLWWQFAIKCMDLLTVNIMQQQLISWLLESLSNRELAQNINRKNFLLVCVKMRCLVAVTTVLSLLSGWSCAQAPGDEDPHCTETLPSIGVNILDYPPEVKPLMDSRHYWQLLPLNNMGAVWQQVDDDNNNPSGVTTNVSCCTGYIHFVSTTWCLELVLVTLCTEKNRSASASISGLPT